MSRNDPPTAPVVSAASKDAEDAFESLKECPAENGVELLNQAAYLYLCSMTDQFEEYLHSLPEEDKFGKVWQDWLVWLAEVRESARVEMGKSYDPSIDYFYKYKQVINNLEIEAKEYVESFDRKGPLDPHFAHLLTCVFANRSKILELAGEFIQNAEEEATTETVKKTPGVSTHFRLAAKKKTENKPEKNDSLRDAVSPHHHDELSVKEGVRFDDVFLLPQSMCSVIGDATPGAAEPVQIRMGTQAKVSNGIEEVSWLFRAQLIALQIEAKAQAETAKKKGETVVSKSPYQWVYFNKLPYKNSSSGFKAWVQYGREKEWSKVLHALEKEHPNLAMINLPSKGGYLKKAYRKGEDQQVRTAREEMLNAVKEALGSNGKSKLVQGLWISENVRRLLTGEPNLAMNLVNIKLENKLQSLIEKSFEDFGFTADVEITAAQRQAVFFHFINFRLPEYIVDTLGPKYFNISCKDGIDRGGVAAAYYKIMKDLYSDPPKKIDKKALMALLHGPATLVKGRTVNDTQQDVVNNALLQFAMAQENKKAADRMPVSVSVILKGLDTKTLSETERINLIRHIFEQKKPQNSDAISDTTSVGSGNSTGSRTSPISRVASVASNLSPGSGVPSVITDMGRSPTPPAGKSDVQTAINILTAYQVVRKSDSREQYSKFPTWLTGGFSRTEKLGVVNKLITALDKKPSIEAAVQSLTVRDCKTLLQGTLGKVIFENSRGLHNALSKKMEPEEQKAKHFVQ